MLNSEIINGMKDSGLSLLDLWKSAIRTDADKDERLKSISRLPEFSKVKSNDALFGVFDLEIEDIGRLYEHSLAIYDNVSKKEGGSFFTPQDVADFMVKKAVDFPKGKWIDPCSGVGILGITLLKEWKKQGNDVEMALKKDIVFSDIDPVANLIAKYLCTKLFQEKDENLFVNAGCSFKVCDFLSTKMEYDFAILNPPYAKTEQDCRFKCAKTGNLYAYFLEKVSDESRGFVSITPESFTHGDAFRPLRKDILRFGSIHAYNFDIVPGYIFLGRKIGAKKASPANNVRATILACKEAKETDILTTDFLRWNDKRRKDMWNALEQKCRKTVHFSKDCFPKTGSDTLNEFLEKMKGVRTVGEICSRTPTGFKLKIGTTPKYFISAVKSEMDRTSSKTLFFKSKDDMDAAYVAINSSVCYAMWRIFDGGLSLSLETILACPVFPLKEKSIVEELEKSEKENKVVKMNAGKAIENIKHPLELVKKATYSVLGDFGERLAYLHKNDYFT